MLGLAAALGSKVERVLLLGCEPELLGDEDEMQMGLSPPVQAAVDEAVRMAESLVREALAETTR